MQTNHTDSDSPVESIDKLHFYLPGQLKQSADPGPFERVLAAIRRSNTV